MRADLIPLSAKWWAARSLWPGKRIRTLFSSCAGDAVTEKWDKNKRKTAGKNKTDTPVNLEPESDRC